MKYYDLKEIANFLNKFKQIFSIQRVEDNIIEICFDKKQCIYFDLTRGNSEIFMCDDFKKSKLYKAPFDISLTKGFTRAKIQKVEVIENERILKFYAQNANSYVSKNIILQLEFTGRHTNAIVLDTNNVIQSALRLIDKNTSARPILIGEILEDLPKTNFIHQKFENIKNIEEFLKKTYEKRLNTRLANLKIQKRTQIAKKIKKNQKLLENLEQENSLLQKAENLMLDGNLILANLHFINTYEKKIELKDFNGKTRQIILPKNIKNPQMAVNSFFTQAKKLKQKAKFLYIEKQNLENKIKFYKNLDRMLEDCQDLQEIEILLPKQKIQKKKEDEIGDFENFYIDNYKIMVGKSQKGNVELLSLAKKSDIWLHIKDMPSTHVIIKTQKQSVPENVLSFAAKLCVNFSSSKDGTFLVDYTTRRNVKVGSDAKVHYVDYKTLFIKKEK